MQEGFYWVRCATAAPEIWFYAEGCGWFEPMNEVPITHQLFLSLGYRVISKQLKPPGTSV